MGSFSDYSENKLLDLAFGGVAFTRPANVYASLHTATLNDAGSGTEVSGTGYARKQIVNNATNWPAASSLSKALAVTHHFAVPGGAWGTATDLGLWDASTSGNLLLEDVLASTQAIVTSDDVTIDATTGLIVTLGGAVSTYLGNKLLDHLLGGGDYSPPASWYLALFVSGVEVTGNNYSRKAVTNNTTNFPAASAGAKTLHVLHAFDDPSGAWGTVDEVRLMDASTAGNIGVAKLLTTPRVVGISNPARFSVDALSFSLS